MKKGLSKLIGALLATSMVLGSVSAADFAPLSAVSTAAASTVQIYNSAGVQEAAYIEWAAVSGTDHYYVSYSKDGSSFTQIDDELIRKYPDRWRADIVGLSAGSYTIKVTCKDKAGSIIAENSVSGVKVVAQDRTGFTFSPKSLAYDNGGCGAYNADGTLKSGANVLYVTEKNFDSVSLPLVNKDGKSVTITGVAGICYTMGAAAMKGHTNPPLAIRFLGTITDAHGDATASLASPGLLETKGQSSNPVNITFEGIGQDTIFNGLAIRLNGVANCEIRNISFWNWHDDAIQLQGNENSNHWIHNNDLFYGENHGGDQKKGDGSTDVKDDSRYITYSYNRYWDCGKTSLCGMKSETGDNYISYHHNWFDHSDSRHPRIRTMFVHVYNNYYDGNAKYGVGAANSSSAFVEGNYFRNCKHPMLSSLQGSDIMENSKTGEPDFSAGGTFSSEPGGIIKAYNNYIEGSDADKFNGGVEPVYYDAADTKTNGKATQFDAYLAKSRDEQVPSSVKALVGGKTFNNANVDSYILSIPVEEPAAAKAKVEAYAGRIGDHFQFQFTAADDTDSEINTALESKLKTYAADTSDDYVSYGGASDGSGPVPTVSTEATTEATTEKTTNENSTEATTASVENSTEATTVNPPVGDNVINQSMTISRGSNDSYVTVYGDKNTSGAWKIDKASGSTVRGYIELKLGKTADLTITSGGEKPLFISNTAGDANGQSLGSGTVTATGLSAGTWYIYNTGGNVTINDIVVKMDGGTVDPTPTPVAGDADGNGKVDNADVQMVLDFASGKISAVTKADLADVNKDGNVTAYDAYLIGKIILGLK
jgi:pectate lyase/amb allergen